MKAPGRLSAALLAAALLAAAVHGQPPDAGLEGTWQYRQANAARPDGLDAEGERLVVTRQADGRVTARYFGLERTGEHGLYYTAVDVGPLQVAADGEVGFTVPARALFRTRPSTVEDAARLEPAGRTTDVLSFRGRRTGESLVLTCTSTPGACPDDRLAFRRLTGGG